MAAAVIDFVVTEYRPAITRALERHYEVIRRRIERLGKRLAAIDTESVVVFTHGGVVRALVCHLLGLELRHYLLFDVGLATVATLHVWDGRGVLAGLTQTPADRETSEA